MLSYKINYSKLKKPNKQKRIYLRKNKPLKDKKKNFSPFLKHRRRNKFNNGGKRSFKLKKSTKNL